MRIPQSLSGDGRLYLHDLTVGQRFTTRSHTLTKEEIVAFARLYDPQGFHLDEAEAENSLFEGLAASGWHTAAISMRLLVESGPRLAGGLVGTSGELSWPRPTRPGDTLHVETEVLEIRPSQSKPDRGIVAVRNLTLKQNGDVAQSFAVRLLVPQKP